MCKYKFKLKHKRHKLTRTYKLDLIETVTTWGGQIIDRKCLQYLKVGDVVRVRFLLEADCWINRYIKITKILSSIHFFGYIRDPYITEEHNSCNLCLEHIDVKELYTCNGEFYNSCCFHVHKKCMQKLNINKEQTFECSKQHPLKKIKVNYSNGTIISFKKNNIIEIPDWSKNTENFGEIFGISKGYMLTGQNGLSKNKQLVLV